MCSIMMVVSLSRLSLAETSSSFTIAEEETTREGGRCYCLPGGGPRLRTCLNSLHQAKVPRPRPKAVAPGNLVSQTAKSVPVGAGAPKPVIMIATTVRITPTSPAMRATDVLLVANFALR